MVCGKKNSLEGIYIHSHFQLLITNDQEFVVQISCMNLYREKIMLNGWLYGKFTVTTVLDEVVSLASLRSTNTALHQVHFREWWPYG